MSMRGGERIYKCDICISMLALTELKLIKEYKPTDLHYAIKRQSNFSVGERNLQNALTNCHEPKEKEAIKDARERYENLLKSNTLGNVIPDPSLRPAA